MRPIAREDQTALSAAWRAGEWDRLTPPLRDVATRAVSRYRGALGRDVIEDVASLTVVRAWTCPYVPDDPAAWVAQVAWRLAYDRLHRTRTVPLGDEADALVSDVPDAETALIDAETQRLALWRLREALRRLPDSMRRCVVLADLHGRSHAAIAAQLGIAVGAVKMRIVRGRRRLAQLYAALPAPPPPSPTRGPPA